jgi:hypothetical protein
MAALESSGASTMPSVKQIRNKLYNDGKAIENFVFDVALRSLDRIATQKEVYGTMVPAEINTNVAPTAFSPGDRQILQDVNNYKASRKNRWPLQRSVLTQFRTQPILNRLRLYCSSAVQHKPVKTNNAKKYTCKLCFVSAAFIPQTSPYKGRSVGRTSTFMCELCGVVLCSEPIREGLKSCHELWHCRENLAAVASTCRKRLLEHRENEDDDALRRKENAKKARQHRNDTT